MREAMAYGGGGGPTGDGDQPMDGAGARRTGMHHVPRRFTDRHVVCGDEGRRQGLGMGLTQWGQARPDRRRAMRVSDGVPCEAVCSWRATFAIRESVATVGVNEGPAPPVGGHARHTKMGRPESRPVQPGCIGSSVRVGHHLLHSERTGDALVRNSARVGPEIPGHTGRCFRAGCRVARTVELGVPLAVGRPRHTVRRTSNGTGIGSVVGIFPKRTLKRDDPVVLRPQSDRWACSRYRYPSSCRRYP